VDNTLKDCTIKNAALRLGIKDSDVKGLVDSGALVLTEGDLIDGHSLRNHAIRARIAREQAAEIATFDRQGQRDERRAMRWKILQQVRREFESKIVAEAERRIQELEKARKA